MNIIKSIKTKAFWRYIEGYGYDFSERKILWQSKKVSWNHIAISYGIRSSDILQRWPIWNTSHNSRRALLFGWGLWYFEIEYYRKKSFNQNRKFPYRSRLWKFYQLFF